MKLITEPGKKASGDLVLKLKVGEEEKITFRDVARMCRFFYMNENNLYPPSKGYRGGEMFADFINKAMRAETLTELDNLLPAFKLEER